jgi:tetratricopeptide (TPR) repeat protein
MRSLWLVGAALALALAACERSDAPSDPIAACLSATDAEARIAACTSAVQAESAAPEQRSIAHSTRAGAYVERGDVTAALRDYEVALQLDEENPEALLGRARILLNSGQLDAAQPLLQRAINLSQAWQAHQMMGQIAVQRGEFAIAIIAFDAALEREPRAAVSLAGRARAKQRSGDIGGATDDYNRAIRIDGSFAEARAGRCWLDLNEGRELERAHQDAEAAVAADPRSVEGQLCRGVLQLRDGQWAEARASFDAALAVESGNPIALFGRGVARRRSGDNQGREDMNLARDFDGHIGEQFDDMGVNTR